MKSNDEKVLGVLLAVTAVVIVGLILSLQYSNPGPTPLKVEPLKNGYSVSMLFDYEGCKVYRFSDDGWRYFVRCGSTVTTFKEDHTAHGADLSESIQTEGK